MRLVLAEDSGLLRESLSKSLGAAGFDVVAAVGNADDLIDEVDRHLPDVALTDIRMPPTHTNEGLRAALALREKHPDLGVLVLSVHADSDYAVELLGDGARGLGYLLKDRVADVEALGEALRRVGDGGTAIDPDVVALMLRRPAKDDGLASLTEREFEILGLVAEGRSNGAIARELYLAPKTVESHISSVMSKLDLLPGPDDHRRVLAVLRYLEKP